MCSPDTYAHVYDMTRPPPPPPKKKKKNRHIVTYVLQFCLISFVCFVFKFLRGLSEDQCNFFEIDIPSNIIL